MQLKDFINYRVEMVGTTDSLQQAAEKMRNLDVGSMPVCDGKQLVGVVTDRDITIRATADGKDPTKTQVKEIMTHDVVCCFHDTEVEEAARIMQENQIRRIFVINEDQELVGVTSLGELATVTGDLMMAGETVKRVSEPPEAKTGHSEGRGQESDGESEEVSPIRERN